MIFSSQRRSFVFLMTVLATLTGAAFGAYEVRGHPDIFEDVLKIAALISTATICASFISWTLTHLKEDSVFLGGLAGLLTGLAIVPTPYFASELKSEFLRLHDASDGGIILPFFEALPAAIQNGVSTFFLISKVSIVAVVSSLILGLLIAKWVPPRPSPKQAENSPSPK